MRFFLLFGLFLPAGCLVAQVTVGIAGGALEMQNGLVRLVVGTKGGEEQYFARSESWHLLLQSGSQLRSDPLLISDGSPVALTFDGVRILAHDAAKAAVELTWKAESHTITRTISLQKGERVFEVLQEDHLEGSHELARFLSTYSFLPDGQSRRDSGRLDFIWTSQLRPDSTDVIGDHTFRTPALMMQKGGRFAALIPDVDRIQPWRSIQTAGDLQVESAPAPLVSYGAMNWRTRSHVFYLHCDQMTTLMENARLLYGYLLYLRADAPVREGYREVVRYDWKRWGRPNLLRGRSPQHEPFSAYRQKAWKEYLPQVAVQGRYLGHEITLLTQGRLAWSNNLPASANTDCWFNVWFNALRTAYGADLYARIARDTSLSRQAEQVLELELLAPEHEGIAPSIFYLDSAGGHWVNDQGWGGIDGGRDFAMFHNAWTGVWLLRWADLLPSRRQEIISRTVRFGDFLLRQQRPSGVIPSWYDPKTLEPVPTFRDENAETAGAALFLAELYRATRVKAYLDGAERAMAYITREILPEEKWYDFETFFSCSRKPVGFFDSFTMQHPQNTLSMHQAAEACLALFQITGKGEYRERGAAIVDYLCLYQQVWSPPWLSRDLFGGFGVQNTDGEWSDSRQGYFAVTLMKYYELTGEREYFERAVASLRAMFSLFESPTSPRTWENYAHSAVDRPGGVTGIHWGTGSSVTSIEILEPRYGGAYVNVAGRWGCGIDGCTVSAVAISGDTVEVTLRDIVASPRDLRVTFGGLEEAQYVVMINGSMRGSYAATDLEKGLVVPL